MNVMINPDLQMDKKCLSLFEQEYLNGKEYTHSLSEAISFAYDNIAKDNTLENYQRLIDIMLYASEIFHSHGDVLKSLQITTLAYGFINPGAYSCDRNIKEDDWSRIFGLNADVKAKTLQAYVATSLLQTFISYISANEIKEKISNEIIEDLIICLVGLNDSGKVDKNAPFYPLMSKYIALFPNIEYAPSFMRKSCYYTLRNDVCGTFALKKHTLYILLPIGKGSSLFANDITLCPFEYKGEWGFMHSDCKHILIPPRLSEVACPKYWRDGTCLVKSGYWYEITKDGYKCRSFAFPRELQRYPGIGIFGCNPWLKTKEYYSEEGQKMTCNDYIYADYGYIVKEDCFNGKISLHSPVDMTVVSPKDIDVFKEYIRLRKKEFIALIPYSLVSGIAIILALKSQYSVISLWGNLIGWAKLSYVCAIIALVASIVFVPKLILHKKGNLIYDEESNYMGLMSLVTIIEAWSVFGLYYLGYKCMCFGTIACWTILIASVIFQFIITCTKRLSFKTYRYGLTSGISFFIITQLISVILFTIIAAI